MEKIIFHPTTLPDGYRYEFTTPFEEFYLDMEDGAQLNGLWFREVAPKGLILYFHGNADNLARWGGFAGDFTKLGYDVLMVDYRTFGKSIGDLSEASLHSDARAIYEYALKKFPAEEIIIYGRSLGTGIATRLASEVPSRMLLLETPYVSMPDLFNEFVPYVGQYLVKDYRFTSDQYIQSVEVPITIFHGTDDWVVPFSQGEKLAEMAGDNVTFVKIEKGSHKNLNTFPIYHEKLAEVLSK